MATAFNCFPFLLILIDIINGKFQTLFSCFCYFSWAYQLYIS